MYFNHCLYVETGVQSRPQQILLARPLLLFWVLVLAVLTLFNEISQACGQIFHAEWMSNKQLLSNSSEDTAYRQQHGAGTEHDSAGLLSATLLQCAQQLHMNSIKHAINTWEHFGVFFLLIYVNTLRYREPSITSRTNWGKQTFLDSDMLHTLLVYKDFNLKIQMVGKFL